MDKMDELRDEQGLTEAEFLAAYTPGDYPRPSMTVDMLLFTVEQGERGKQDLKLLLIRRKNHPYMNCWAIPGGFVEMNENLDAAARRELKEETNIENVYMEQLYTFGDVGRDPRMRVISAAYLALVQKEHCKAQAGDDAADAAWFTVRKERVEELSETVSTWRMTLENEEKDICISYIVTEEVKKNGVISYTESRLELAFDSEYRLAFDHGKIINMAVERIRNKAEYTPILFNLLPAEFTLPQAQQVYETMLGRSVSKPGFRKKFMNVVEACEKRETHVDHRPGLYYRYRGKLSEMGKGENQQ
jgi:ADP-ribose pyrophosphatase YjhB (NUDIX family)